MLWDLNIENVDKTFLKYSVIIYMKDGRKSDVCYLSLPYASKKKFINFKVSYIVKRFTSIIDN